MQPKILSFQANLVEVGDESKESDQARRETSSLQLTVQTKDDEKQKQKVPLKSSPSEVVDESKATKTAECNGSQPAKTPSLQLTVQTKDDQKQKQKFPLKAGSAEVVDESKLTKTTQRNRSQPEMPSLQLTAQTKDDLGEQKREQKFIRNQWYILLGTAHIIDHKWFVSLM